MDDCGEALACASVKQLLVQILMILANIRLSFLKAEVRRVPCEQHLDCGSSILRDGDAPITQALRRVLKTRSHCCNCGTLMNRRACGLVMKFFACAWVKQLTCPLIRYHKVFFFHFNSSMVVIEAALVAFVPQQ